MRILGLTILMISLDFFVHCQLDCRNAQFPKRAFEAQPNKSKVYFRVDRINDDGFKKAGFNEFITVFGIPIIKEDGVSNEKLLHLGTVLAEMLDNKQSGITRNINLVKALLERNAVLGLTKSLNSLQSIMQYKLPSKYHCSMYLILEEENIVIPNGITNVSCDEINIIEIDRTAGFVGDFLTQAGYPFTFESHTRLGSRVEEGFITSKKKNYFNPSKLANSDTCDIHCERVSFQSWALTSALGIDQCLCEKLKVWTLCSPEKLRQAEPILYGALIGELKVPEGKYHSIAVEY